MIITVTMNPAIDKTARIERMIRGKLNRIGKVTTDAGGKGINVSRNLRILGEKSIATGFLGGDTGATIERKLQAEGIETDFVWIPGETRTNLKITEPDGTVTECNETGMPVGESHIQLLLEKLDRYAGPDTVLVLAGSVPSGVPTDIYAAMIRRYRTRGAAVFLDAEGDLFSKAIAERPDMIKPNQEELKLFFHEKGETGWEWIARKVRWFQEQGIQKGAVSMGKEGALLFDARDIYRCPAVDTEVLSTVGAGDAMVAAMVYAREHRLKTEEWIRLCMAVSAAAVSTEGTRPAEIEKIRDLYHKAEFCRL